MSSVSSSPNNAKRQRCTSKDQDDNHLKLQPITTPTTTTTTTSSTVGSSSLSTTNNTKDKTITDTSGYLFKNLTGFDLQEMRKKLLHAQKTFPTMKGTILLSVEGINVRLSGPTMDILSYKKVLNKALLISETTDNEVSCSGSTPSNGCTSKIDYKDVSNPNLQNPTQTRFLIKIKKELISMGFPNASPHLTPSPAIHLTPTELNVMVSDRGGKGVGGGDILGHAE